ncbi:hypothetical protein D5S18_17960 [Nocardia panacis]|uniref:Uncharacterized protein n=1 Tax=Nocardia panacis TaxID=2340916 RepID=A0A3A4JX97_9NOCA|nr:hypothetical protein [Nocardia panacis]RJO75239.1 hypothetical protein D5S18_17960 [Nocardia panacis]
MFELLAFGLDGLPRAVIASSTEWRTGARPFRVHGRASVQWDSSGARRGSSGTTAQHTAVRQATVVSAAIAAQAGVEVHGGDDGRAEAVGQLLRNTA